MRKKYLSALLFGALLLASAGTFTSCSDYDDDIKNLQEQINTVVSDLESLKTKVDGLGGYVTDVKVENGKLVVTANGSTVSYDLPAGGSSEVANIEIKNGHLYVNGTDKGSVGSTVTVNEEGKLVIDGEVSDLKVGTEVIIKDASNGMYTISIDGQTIQLPMASASITVSGTDKVFTEYNVANTTGGIVWGVAGDAVADWKGPKGPVAKEQLLIGQMNEVKVNVLPVSYDLGAQELKLVDSEGNIAPVTVDAVSTENDGPIFDGGSRAANAKGEWKLTIALTDDVTAENIDEIFTTKVDDENKNVKYALSVNGSLVTGYDYVVDTAEKQFTDYKFLQWVHVFVGGEALSTATAEAPLGETAFEIRDSRVYDYYIEVFEGDENDADKFGVKVEGNKIIASDKAADQSIRFVIRALDVNGNVVKPGSNDTEMTVKFGKTQAGDAIELAAQNYKVTPATDKGAIVVDLGDVFTSLTAEQATATLKATWSAKDFVTLNTSAIKYYPTAECKDGEELDISDVKNNSKKIKFAKLPISAYSDKAKVGVNEISLVLSNTNGDIKKATVPVNVTLPAFDELFTKTNKWSNNELNLRLIGGDSNSIVANMVEGFTAVAEMGVTTDKIVYTVDKIDNAEVATSANGKLTLDKTVVVDDNSALKVKKLTASAYYQIGNNENFQIKTTDKFTVNIKSIFEDASLVYYNNSNDASTEAVVVSTTSGGNEIKAYVAASGSTKANGLAVKFGNDVESINANNIVDGIKLVGQSDTPAATDVKVTTAVKVGGLNVSANLSDGAVVFKNDIKTGDHGTITVEFTDYCGIKTTASIAFKK